MIRRIKKIILILRTLPTSIDDMCCGKNYIGFLISNCLRQSEFNRVEEGQFDTVTGNFSGPTSLKSCQRVHLI